MIWSSPFQKSYKIIIKRHFFQIFGSDAIVRFEDGTNFKSQMPVNRCLSVNEDGSRIALGGPDGGISIHLTDGRLEHHWEGHCEGTVYAVKYMGDFLFTASALCDIRCWQMVKSKPKLVCSKSNIHDTRKWFHILLLYVYQSVYKGRFYKGYLKMCPR